MILTNRHVGWGIIILAILAPWIPVLFGQQVFPIEGQLGSEIPILSWVRGVEVFGGGIVAIGLILFFGIHWTSALLSDDIEFKWRIPLSRTKPKTNDKELFLKLHELPQGSKEWEQVYSELDKKGTWG